MYRSHYRCKDCKHEFYKITKEIPNSDPECPQCKKTRMKTKSCVSDKMHDFDNEKVMKEMIENRTPPGTIGNKRVKAFDAAMEMTMQDYGMTDIKDNAREGENSVPRLPNHLEKQVDEVFKPQKNNVAGLAGDKLNKAIMAGVQSGAYRNYGDVVQRQQNSGTTVPVNIIHHYDGKQ